MSTMNGPPKELLDDLLPGEKVYPIFDLRARWTQDMTDRGTNPAPWQICGLPAHRIWNGCSWYEMPKLEESAGSDGWAIARESMAAWWSKYKVNEKNRDLNLADLRFTVTFQRWEVWCMQWFQHWTWDIGLSDEEVLESFGRYVFRTELLNERERGHPNYRLEPAYCLMGAEDRYRWRGSKTGAPDDRTDPPCRCPHCKEQGVVRIAH